MLRPQTNTHRTQLSLDGLWSFRVQCPEDDASAWHQGFATDRVVGVPASFNEQFTDYDTFNHMGVAWYSRPFTVPAALRGQEIWLHFAAVNYHATVYLNGQLLGTHETGYTPFCFPAAAALLDAGENLLVVRVDCALSPHTVPQGGFDKAAIPGLSSPFKPSVNFDFFPYSGIHRSVSLLALPAARVESLFIDTTLDGSEGVVHVRGTLSVPVARVGFGIAEWSDFSDASDGSFTATLRIPNARLWDIGKPNLHTLDITVSTNGSVTDSYRQTFGIRSIELRGDRLLLNGEPIYLTGFGKHEDFPVLGRTQPDAVNVRDLELLKWIGANSFRTGKPIMITEIGADAMAGLHSLPASLWTEDYQTDLLETNLNIIREKDYILGEHLWAFSDFHTAQNHFRAHGNRKGLFTRDRQPKAAAHMLRKRWTQA